MSKFESAPNLNNNNLELKSSETGADVSVAKKQESELTSKELEKLKVEEGQEQGVEKPELSPEEQLENLKSETEARQQEITRLTEFVEETNIKLKEAREKLGLSSIEEDPPSVFSEKERLEKLQAEKEALEKQTEDLISQQEKERLIRDEKEKILQEKLDEVFKEFKDLNLRDFESIFKSGKTPEGRNVESKSMGFLEPKVAQSLAKAFKEGIKLLPKILEALPELLEKFDEDLTKEATERVEKKLEAEKQEMEEEEKLEELKPEERPEILEGKISADEIKQGASPVEGGNIENPKV